MTWARLLEGLRMFFKGALMDNLTERLATEQVALEDELMFFMFSDLFGFPSPFPHVAIELVPILADKIEPWLRRMASKRSVLSEKFGQCDGWA